MTLQIDKTKLQKMTMEKVETLWLKKTFLTKSQASEPEASHAHVKHIVHSGWIKASLGLCRHWILKEAHVWHLPGGVMGCQSEKGILKRKE